MEEANGSRRETILESLIRKPATQPKLEYQEEPSDWRPSDKCYFCVDGDGAERPAAGGAPVSNAPVFGCGQWYEGKGFRRVFGWRFCTAVRGVLFTKDKLERKETR